MADAKAKEIEFYNDPAFVFGTGVPADIAKTLPAKVGEKAPDFEVVTIDGARVRLSDLQGKHVIIMTGAVTSPMCAYEMPALNRLQEEFARHGMLFYLLYTRESHAAEHYPAHETLEQKIAYARDLQRLENVQVPILIDDLAGTVHRNYGPWPAALFVIDRNGRLVYRSNMANLTELKQFLADVVFAEEMSASGEMLHTEYSERLVPHLADQATHHRVYERAGPFAFEEHWQRRPDLRNRWP